MAAPSLCPVVSSAVFNQDTIPGFYSTLLTFCAMLNCVLSCGAAFPIADPAGAEGYL